MERREKKAKWYKNRKDNGLCPRCGKERDREGHYCSECLEKNRTYRRENRKFYREHHICTECGKEIVLGTDKTCPECRAKRNNRRKPLTNEQKKRYAERFKMQQKSLYQERKEQGICIRCGKRKAKKDRVKCSICLSKDMKYRKRDGISRSERPGYGICYICGNPIDSGGRMCRNCTGRSISSLPKTGGNKYWKKDNDIVFQKR